MIKSISYWSLQHGLDNTHPIDAALEEAKSAGFAGLELCIAPEGVLNTRSSQGECEDIRRLVDAKQMTVETLACGISWGTNPTSDDSQVRQLAIQLHADALQRAAWLGCEAVLMVPGVVKSPISPELIRYDTAVDRAREAVKQLLEVAEKVGVDLCLENVWNGLFYSPLELCDFIDSYGSDRLGVYLDIGNLLGYHQYPPHWVEILGKRIRRLHIKDFKESVGSLKGFCDLLEGDVPFEPTMRALKKLGYDKTVVAEMIPWREGLLEKTSRAMDDILLMA